MKDNIQVGELVTVKKDKKIRKAKINRIINSREVELLILEHDNYKRVFDIIYPCDVRGLKKYKK